MSDTPMTYDASGTIASNGFTNKANATFSGWNTQLDGN
jgi:hypothetical protein